MTLRQRLTGLIGTVGLILTTPALAHTHHHPVHHIKPKALHYNATPIIASQVSTVPATYSPQGLANEISFLISKNNRGADIGVYVKSMQRGDVLYNLRSQNSFTPASTMKVLTAESALLYLGPNYRFATQLLTDATKIASGTLQGNLYVVLSGDPTLTAADLTTLIGTLKTRQISRIAGNVYIDETAYDQNDYGPDWSASDEGYCYGAPISAGIIDHNCVISKNASVVINNVNEYDREFIQTLLHHESITVTGTVALAPARGHLALLAQHASAPLPVLITTMLKKSDNIIAGALFKKLGELYTRQPGSWKNGSLAVQGILAKYTGVNLASVRVLDGSGLSPDNLVQPAQLLHVLDFAYHNPNTAPYLINALPIAGIDGTLKHRLYPVARRVHAKTGTLLHTGVSALAGYATTNRQETLAFVIMVNSGNSQGWRYRDLIDQITTALVRFDRA